MIRRSLCSANFELFKAFNNVLQRLQMQHCITHVRKLAICSTVSAIINPTGIMITTSDPTSRNVIVDPTENCIPVRRVESRISSTE